MKWMKITVMILGCETFSLKWAEYYPHNVIFCVYVYTWWLLFLILLSNSIQIYTKKKKEKKRIEIIFAHKQAELVRIQKHNRKANQFNSKTILWKILWRKDNENLRRCTWKKRTFQWMQSECHDRIRKNILSK